MAIQAPSLRGTSFYLPEFPYLLPARLHPDSDRICRESNAWVRENMGFAMSDPSEMDCLIEEGAALWTCYVLPTADPGRLLDLCNYTEYLSVFDNAMVDRERIGQDPQAASELFRRVAAIIEGTASDDDLPWGTALHELWDRMRHRFPPQQWRRLMHEIQRFLSGCVHEIGSRSDDRVFDYETYLAVRRDSVGMGMYLVLGEYGLGIDMTETLAEHPELPAIVGIALEHIMLTNDLFSYRAECAADDFVNALSVLQISEGLNLQDSVDRLFAVIEERRREFMRARRAIETGALGARADVHSYLDALWHMMAGNLQWSYLTSRYNGVGHTWNEIRSGIVTLYPDRTEFGPAPYWSLPR